MTKKRFQRGRLCLCTAVVGLLAFAGCFTENEVDDGTKHAPYGDPLYTGNVDGSGSDTHSGGTCTVKIKLTLAEGYITAVDFTGSTGNTSGIGEVVLQNAPATIIARNSVEIDANSSASKTRNALITAGKQALAKIPGYTPEE